MRAELNLIYYNPTFPNVDSSRFIWDMMNGSKLFSKRSLYLQPCYVLSGQTHLIPTKYELRMPILKFNKFTSERRASQCLLPTAYKSRSSTSRVNNIDNTYFEKNRMPSSARTFVSVFK